MSLPDAPKRAADVLGSAILLAVTMPLQAVIAGVLLLAPGPVLFRQPRPGLGGAVFELIKFRTMSAPRWQGEDDSTRITTIGRLLRATSLDELPTLWNVLRGDMSLVGPRPLLVEYLPLYSDEQLRRHEVRPGMTGLAQVSGRNALSWEERLRLDVDYVEHRTGLIDIKILLKTVRVVFSGRGVSQPGHATMTRFTRAEPWPSV